MSESPGANQPTSVNSFKMASSSMSVGVEEREKKGEARERERERESLCC